MVITCNLDKEMCKKFDAVKAFYDKQKGSFTPKTKSSVIRILVNNEYECIKKERIRNEK